MEFNTEIFSQFHKKWALLTAGNENDFNTMTVSWGGMGTIWNKPVATVYVRTSRLTHEYMENNDYFTLSFFPEECREILGVLGKKSGRDMDKMKESGLTPKACENSMTFAEAEVTIVCKKLYKQTLDPSCMPADIAKQHYEGQPDHDMYIGEVVAVIQ
ncbi:MAG: flavin reductase [Pseudobutyrivibrio sp.]|nr:flavin reductase [Pseudobutyrivibrio sp.]